MVVTQMAALSKSNQEVLDPSSIESASQLELLWRRWCEQESINRLIYFSWILDTQASIAHDINIIFSYEDMNTALPASRDLWTAPSAKEWRLRAVERGQWKNDLSLKDVMRDPSLLVSYQHSIDVTFGQLALLGGCWTLVRDYRQIMSLTRGGSNFNLSVLDFRRDELATYLERLQMEFRELGPARCEVEMLRNLVAMHIYTSFRDVEIFAGRQGLKKEGNPRYEFIVRQWAQNAESRKAVYHAGQIIRAAEIFPACLYDIYTVALFQAGLVLWACGILVRNECPISTSAISELTTTRSALNCSVTESLKRYMLSGEGFVGLQGHDGQFIPLTNPAAIINFVICILQASGREQVCSTINEEFLRLLNGLHSATLKFENSSMIS